MGVNGIDDVHLFGHLVSQVRFWARMLMRSGGLVPKLRVSDKITQDNTGA